MKARARLEITIAPRIAHIEGGGDGVDGVDVAGGAGGAGSIMREHIKKRAFGVSRQSTMLVEEHDAEDMSAIRRTQAPICVRGYVIGRSHVECDPPDFLAMWGGSWLTSGNVMRIGVEFSTNGQEFTRCNRTMVRERKTRLLEYLYYQYGEHFYSVLLCK